MEIDLELAKEIIKLIKQAENEVKDMYVIDLKDEDELLVISNHKEAGGVTINLIQR